MSSSKHSVVLLSGGLDSVVLLAEEARHAVAHPVYVSVGFAWEAAEQAVLTRVLRAPVFSRVAPLVTLRFDMRDVYSATHWAMEGDAPAYDTPDEDVYLPGRNLVLLTKAAVLAATRHAGRIVLGTLANNPFPDATPAFFETMSQALSLGLARPLEVAAPFAALDKHEVIRLGETLGVPLANTVSCLDPVLNGHAWHCGRCSKCRERRDAFQTAGVRDATMYVSASPRVSAGGGAVDR